MVVGGVDVVLPPPASRALHPPDRRGADKTQVTHPSPSLPGWDRFGESVRRASAGRTVPIAERSTRGRIGERARFVMDGEPRHDTTDHQYAPAMKLAIPYTGMTQGLIPLPHFLAGLAW